MSADDTGGVANCVIPRELKEGIGKLIGGGGAYVLLVVVAAPVANMEGTTDGIPDGIEAEYENCCETYSALNSSDQIPQRKVSRNSCQFKL